MQVLCKDKDQSKHLWGMIYAMTNSAYTTAKKELSDHRTTFLKENEETIKLINELEDEKAKLEEELGAVKEKLSKTQSLLAELNQRFSQKREAYTKKLDLLTQESEEKERLLATCEQNR